MYYLHSWLLMSVLIVSVLRFVMKDLNFDLVVFSPYRSLSAFLRDSSLGEVVGLRAWTILNDSYRTDVSLLHPPHLVALACLQLAVVHLDLEVSMRDGGNAASTCTAEAQRPRSPELQHLSRWMKTLSVDCDQLYDIVVDITFMYEKHSVPISVEECNRLLDAVCGWVNVGVVAR